ncbi:MAG: methyltransferase domain-containing protein [Thermomicrobiales bacterium]|nr:methyltransferase domain-containing protein [Thermomicrobiales bacterium]
MTDQIDSRWHNADAYERYMGRWSRRIAAHFLTWLDPADGQSWLDLGCGTGALSATILERTNPVAVTGVDPSEPFIAAARSTITDPRATFHIGDARALPLAPASIDCAVSGLCLNFIPDPALAIAEMSRVTRPGGVVASYVWDYVQGMEMIRAFWHAARAVDPELKVDEAHRNPLCAPDPLHDLFTRAGLVDVLVTSIEIETRFASFDDYWGPFDGGTGPAPAYLKTLSPGDRDELAAALRRTLPFDSDGSIPLSARVWAVRGTVPPS